MVVSFGQAERQTPDARGHHRTHRHIGEAVTSHAVNSGRGLIESIGEV